MRKLIQLLIVACLLAGVMLIPAAAQGPPPGEIWLFLPDGASNVVIEGEDMRVKWAWVATTRGLVNTYLRASEHTYRFYDETVWNDGNPTGPPAYVIAPEQAEIAWGPLFSLPPAEVGLDCPRPSVWLSFWDYEVDLAAGSYVLEVIQDLRHPVNDGYHTCTWLENGEPAGPTPSLYPRGESTFSVVDVLVLPPLP